MINVIPSGEPITFLRNQELVKEGNAKVCGALLFCDEPAIYLPKRSSIKIMRYKTKEDDIGREFLEGNPITIEGDAYNLIYHAVEATKKIVEGVQKLGESGLESVTYPARHCMRLLLTPCCTGTTAFSQIPRYGYSIIELRWKARESFLVT